MDDAGGRLIAASNVRSLHRCVSFSNKEYSSVSVDFNGRK